MPVVLGPGESLLAFGKCGALQKTPDFCTHERAAENPHERWTELGDFGEGFLYPAAEVP
jgi:hypothetical protein